MLRNPKVHCYNHKRPLLCSILNQIARVTATLTLYFPDVAFPLPACRIKFWYEFLWPPFHAEYFHVRAVGVRCPYFIQITYHRILDWRRYKVISEWFWRELEVLEVFFFFSFNTSWSEEKYTIFIPLLVYSFRCYFISK